MPARHRVLTARGRNRPGSQGHRLSSRRLRVRRAVQDLELRAYLARAQPDQELRCRHLGVGRAAARKNFRTKTAWGRAAYEATLLQGQGVPVDATLTTQARPRSAAVGGASPPRRGRFSLTSRRERCGASLALSVAALVVRPTCDATPGQRLGPLTAFRSKRGSLCSVGTISIRSTVPENARGNAKRRHGRLSAPDRARAAGELDLPRARPRGQPPR